MLFRAAKLCSGGETVLNPVAVIMRRKAMSSFADLPVSRKAGYSSKMW